MVPLKRTRGFTLVELLVVVGIIAVLISLLLPALSRAREHANRVKCAANLRSIGQALTMYTQQYGYYPGYKASGTTGKLDYAVWPVRLRAFMGGSREAFNCPSRDDRFMWVKGAAPATPADAATATHASFGYEAGEPILWTQGTAFSYGYNFAGAVGRPDQKGLGFFVNGHEFFGPRFSARELKATRVRRPAEMIAVADSNGDAADDTGINAMVQSVFPGTVHGGGANVLFCDGHVQWYRQDELALLAAPTNSPETFQWNELGRRWNNDHRGPIEYW